MHQRKKKGVLKKKQHIVVTGRGTKANKIKVKKSEEIYRAQGQHAPEENHDHMKPEKEKRKRKKKIVCSERLCIVASDSRKFVNRGKT